MHRSDICLSRFTLIVPKSHRQPRRTFQFVSEDGVLARLSVSKFLLSTSPFFQPHKQKSYAVRSVDSSSCLLVTIQNSTPVRTRFMSRNDLRYTVPPESFCIRVICFGTLSGRHCLEYGSTEYRVRLELMIGR